MVKFMEFDWSCEHNLFSEPTQQLVVFEEWVRSIIMGEMMYYKK